MVYEDVMDLLERVVGLGGGKVACEYVRQSPGPCWSVTLNVMSVDRYGLGSGDTLLEAIDDCLDDFADDNRT